MVDSTDPPGVLIRARVTATDAADVVEPRERTVFDHEAERLLRTEPQGMGDGGPNRATMGDHYNVPTAVVR